MKKQARKSPDFLKDSVIYQLFLRSFTPEGTLAAAAKILPHIADLGFDIVYLCPVVEHDDDPRHEYWSDRQHKSEIGNPKNPYRLKDYFKVDEEYGTDEDLRDFIEKAHGVGMKVLLDLVYLHCGPKASFIDEHPDFVKRDEDGNVVNGSWHFPLINFECRELREYLWRNMEYFMKEFNVDGYRCDVAPGIPLDFWEEGRKRMEAIDPDCVMISEGDREDDQLFAFDLNYAFKWKFGIIKVLKNEITALELTDIWKELNRNFPDNARFLRIMDDHDIANDCYEKRHDVVFGTKAVDAALVVNFTLDGVPFIYNGQELADNSRHSIYANRFYGKNMTINWSNAVTDEGRNRMEHIGSLIELRRSTPALTEGTVEWLEHDQADSVLVFVRACDDRKVVVAVNMTDKALTATMDVDMACPYPRVLFDRGSDFSFGKGKLSVDMLPYGYVVIAC